MSDKNYVSLSIIVLMLLTTLGAALINQVDGRMPRDFYLDFGQRGIHSRRRILDLRKVRMVLLVKRIFRNLRELINELLKCAILL